MHSKMKAKLRKGKLLSNILPWTLAIPNGKGKCPMDGNLAHLALLLARPNNSLVNIEGDTAGEKVRCTHGTGYP